MGKVILLSEIAHNGEYIKTKSIQDGVKMLQSLGIEPWIILARDTKEIGPKTLSERLSVERLISGKVSENIQEKFMRVISIPFFENILEYTDFVKKRFLPLLTPLKSSNIFLATKNKSKISDFKLYLSDTYELKMPMDFPHLEIEIMEGIESIEDNALAKARSYAVATGMISIGDDTGFFIEQLDGEPGVAVKRWGGELSEKTSGKEFWEYLQKKTINLNTIECYFEQCIAIVSPDGRYKIIYSKNEGILNKDKLKLEYNGSGYPLAQAFESKNRKMTWDEMTDDQKKDFDKKLIKNLKNTLKKFF
ncbi:MAG: hypothetical protein LBU87_03180 [Lactobacillales bacterium]|jgi:XTP/dITP diphosphohydrolase|nr:hypothetical protein [Lactobacillales bacterium]